MSSRDDRRRELETLLREPVDPLPPRPGAWEQIDRRATRRKWAKATLAAAAAVVVVAGAVPAVIAVRHNSDNQTLAISSRLPRGHGSSTNSAAPTPRVSSIDSGHGFPGLHGYFPESVSFISQTEGFLWGSQGRSPRGVVARTENGGRSWVRIKSPPVDDAFVGMHGGDTQIRFASSHVGFVYGARNFITTDGGGHWRPFTTPGYIADLEAAKQRIWALVRPCSNCTAVRLYSASAKQPVLHRVGQVPVMHSIGGTTEVAGAAAVAVSGNHVDVIVGSSGYWSSNDGKVWKQRADPCPTKVDGTSVESTVLSSTTSAGVVAACGYHVSGSTETKRLYASPASGAGWQPLSAPPSTGYLQTITGIGESDIIVGTSRGGAQISHNGGMSWLPAAPQEGVGLSFVGFIDQEHVVAVADRADSSTGAFAASYDGGRQWTLTGFP